MKTPKKSPQTAEEFAEELARVIEERDYTSRQEVADMLEVSPPRISAMVKEGIVPQDAQGRHPRRETMHALFRWMRQRLCEGKSEMGALKLEARRMENEILASAVAKAKKEVVPLAEVQAGLDHLVLSCRAKLLALPGKVAGRVAFLRSEIEIENEIRNEVEAALRELAQPIDFGGSTEDL